MAPPLVSIVIVAHNNWPDLDLAIESALGQSDPHVEVIVVDNGSTDSTADHVAALFGDRVRLVHRGNLGDARGYNDGVALSRGEFVQILDGDDFPAPDKIAKQVALLRADPGADIAYGDVRQFQSGSGVAGWEDWDTVDQPDMLRALVDPCGNGGGLVIHSALFRRAVIDRIGGWDESIKSADQEYWFRAAWAGCRFRYCPRSLSFYRRRPDQLSASTLGMMRCLEQSWAAALGNISRDPCRRILAARLAQLRFYLAISSDTPAGEALRQLAAARATSPGALPRGFYTAGRLLIRLPGGRRLVRTPRLRYLRAGIARTFGFA